VAIAEIPKYYRDFGTWTTSAAVETTAAAPTLVNSSAIPTPSSAPSGPQMVVFSGLLVPLAGSIKQPDTPPTACKKRRPRHNVGQDAIKKAKSNNGTVTSTAPAPTEVDSDAVPIEYNLVDAPVEYHNLMYHTLSNPSQTDGEGLTFAQAYAFESTMDMKEYKTESVDIQPRSINIENNRHRTPTGTGLHNVFPFSDFDIPAQNTKEFAAHEMDQVEEFDVNAMHVDIEDMPDSFCVVSVCDMAMPMTSKEELAFYRMMSFCD